MGTTGRFCTHEASAAGLALHHCEAGKRAEMVQTGFEPLSGIAPAYTDNSACVAIGP